jgi:tetratricopeptide (TPR) repeat protein
MTGYEIGDIIGRGGMGVVHSGRHVGLDRPVAVKFLSETLSGDPEFSSRFLREARICARLDHPGIVRVYDTGSDGGRPYIVMELLEGETLRQRLKQGALPEGEAVRIAQEVLAALEAAHQDHVVHRDVKSGNVFLCRSGQVKVMDFGIARALAEVRLTGTGTRLGTPEYMSPEQVQGQVVDARSDLYSTGILLYEMLTGEVPFRADTPVAVLHMQVAKPPPSLFWSASRRTRQIVEKALAKSRVDRFPSAAAMSEALASLPEEVGRGVPRWLAAAAAAASLLIGAVALSPLATARAVVAPQPRIGVRAALAPRHRKAEAAREAERARQIGDEVDAAIRYWVALGKKRSLSVEEAWRVRARLAGRCAEALERARRAIELEPGNRLAWLQRVRALRLAARDAAARSALSDALSRFPEDAGLKQEEKLLAP